MIDRQRLTDRRLYLRQAPWRLRMAWHTARAEYHRLAGNYWQILNQARRGDPPRITAEDTRQLDAIAEQTGVPRDQRLTAHQLAEVIRRASPELAAKLITRWQQDSETARQCFELNHQGQIDRYRAEERRRFEAEVAARRG